MVNVTYNIIQCTYGPNHFTQVILTIQYLNNITDKIHSNDTSIIY